MTWRIVAAALIAAAVLLLLSVSIFGSFIPGLVLVVLVGVFAGLTVAGDLR